MPAQFVKPHVKSNKNDFNDATAIAEAVRRLTMRFVTTKTTEQHDLQALHRVRERLIQTRTSVICQMRSFLLENGIAVRTGRIHLTKALLTLPGVGPLVATALVASVGNGRQFKRGRELAAWLGLVPREHSTGGKQRLLGISKRGSSYLRKLMIHGARSCYLNMNREPHRMGQWIDQLGQRGAHRNIIVVALANKLSRICWAVMRDGSVYHCVKA